MAGVETRSKKKPLSPSPYKIGMVEKQTPSSSDKKKLERADKKGSPRPLRRSGRIEKNGFSSPSSSKKSSNSSSSQGNKNKEENIEKLKAADTDEQSNNNEADTKSGGSSTKRKRLDFRSYRSFLMPQVKRAKCSEAFPNHHNLGSESTPCSTSGLITPCSTSGLIMPEFEGTEKLCNSQMDLHLMLKPGLLNLCGILKLPVQVQVRVRVRFHVRVICSICLMQASYKLPRDQFLLRSQSQ